MAEALSHFAQNINFPICKFLDHLSQQPFNQDKPAVSFLSGDPTIYGQKQFQMPQRGYEILQDHILNQNNHGYCGSTGIPEFRNSIKALYNPKFPIQLSDIHVNHGVNMGLLAVLMAFTNEEDQILVPELGYPFYQDVCPALKRKAVPYKLKKDSNFEIDLQQTAKLVTEKTAFMYIINPTNPMGTVFSRKHMQQILEFAGKHEVPLVVDEVYFKLVYPGVQALSFGDLTEDVPVVVLCGVEKILSVPGWVQSWTVIFDKHRILDQIKSNLEVVATLFLHTNTFTMHSMPQILKEIGIFTVDQMPAIHQNYLALTDRLKPIHGLRPLPAQGTIYLTVEIELEKFNNIESDVHWIQLFRKEQNVNILPISIMGKGVQGFRLLTCGGNELYDSFFQRLELFVNRHKL